MWKQQAILEVLSPKYQVLYILVNLTNHHFQLAMMQDSPRLFPPYLRLMVVDNHSFLDDMHQQLIHLIQQRVILPENKKIKTKLFLKYFND